MENVTVNNYINFIPQKKTTLIFGKLDPEQLNSS